MSFIITIINYFIRPHLNEIKMISSFFFIFTNLVLFFLPSQAFYQNGDPFSFSSLTFSRFIHSRSTNHNHDLWVQYSRCRCSCLVSFRFCLPCVLKTLCFSHRYMRLFLYDLWRTEYFGTCWSKHLWAIL